MLRFCNLQAEGPYASAKSMRNLQRAQSASRRSDRDASCEIQAGSRVRSSPRILRVLSAFQVPVIGTVRRWFQERYH